MCTTQTENQLEATLTGLFEHWHLEVSSRTGDPVYQFVEIDSILGHSLTFQLTKNSLDPKKVSTEFTKLVIVVKDRQTIWPQIFLNGIGKRNENKHHLHPEINVVSDK
jgi:hypothetical protein